MERDLWLELMNDNNDNNCEDTIVRLRKYDVLSLEVHNKGFSV